MSIVVTTPTGNIGSRVVDRLLAAGAEVSVLVRDASRLREDVRPRVTAHEGSLDDPAFVRSATRGATALFLVVPPHMTAEDPRGFQRTVGRTIADAARANGIERVVFVSSSGAQRDDLTLVSGLGEVERLLNDAVPNVVALRAAFFLENYLSALPSVAAQDTIYMTRAPERRAALVAAADIGDVAADLLLDPSWRGHLVRGVHGAADYTPLDVAAAVSEALGRTIQYVQVPYDGLLGALRSGGASEPVIAAYDVLFRALDREDISAEPRTPQTTTATTVSEWARDVFAAAVPV